MTTRGLLVALALMLLIAVPVACMKQQARAQPPGASLQPPLASKRQRFVPQADTAQMTSWTTMDKPSVLNPDGWAVMARMALGGVAPINPDGAASPRFRMKLVEGDADAITLRVSDEKSNVTLELQRDVPQEVSFDGKDYLLLYPTTHVAPDQPDTSRFAHVILKPVEADVRAPADPSLEALQDRLVELEFKKEQMSMVLGERHRDMVGINNEIELTQRLIERRSAQPANADNAQRGGWPEEPHRCAQNLKNIGLAIHIHLDREGKLPANLGQTLKYVDRNAQMSEDDRRSATAAEKAAMYLCPLAGPILPQDPTPQWVNENTSFVYLADAAVDLKKLTQEQLGATVIVHEKLERGHKTDVGEVIVLLMADGHAELVSKDQARQMIDASKQRLAGTK